MQNVGGRIDGDEGSDIVNFVEVHNSAYFLDMAKFTNIEEFHFDGSSGNLFKIKHWNLAAADDHIQEIWISATVGGNTVDFGSAGRSSTPLADGGASNRQNAWKLNGTAERGGELFDKYEYTDYTCKTISDEIVYI